MLWVWFVMSQHRGTCGRTVLPIFTSQSRVVSPVPLFSAVPTTADDDAFPDCSHDDIKLFSHQQFIVVSFSNNL